MIIADFETLLLADPTQSRSTSHIFIAHPTPLEERTLGKVFLVVEIDDKARVSHDVIAVIQEELKTAYYHAADFSLEAAFEQALSHVNQRLHQLIEGGVTDWLQHINLAAGVIRDQDLILTTLGRVHAFYFHGSQAIDIADGATTRERINPLKVFSAVITGRLTTSDSLLVTTGALLDYFSPERLRRFLQDSAPGTALTAIEAALNERPPDASFAAVALSVQQDEQPQLATARSGVAATPVITERPHASMNQLLSRERATDDLLSSSFWRSVSRGAQVLGSTMSAGLQRFVFRRPPRRRLPAGATTPLSRADIPYRTRFQQEQRGVPSRTGRVFRNIGQRLLIGTFWLLRHIVRFFQNPRRVTHGARQLPARSSSVFERPLHWFQRLNRNQRIVVLAALVLLFFFAQSIVSLGQQRSVKLSKADRSDIVQQVHDKATAAEAALSYGNEIGAQQLDTEARALIAKLPTRTKADRTAVAQLNDSWTTIRQKLRHLVVVESPTLVADVGPVSAQADPRTISLIGTQLVAVDGNGQRLFHIDGATGKSDSVTLPKGLGTIRRALTDSKTTVLLVGSTGLASYAPKTKVATPVALARASGGESIDDATLFSGRLYVWAKDQQQIFRHSRSAAGFGLGSAWLKDQTPADLNNVMSIGVNGVLFTLANDGTLIQYSQGTKAGFQAAAPDPAWKNPNLMWTGDNTTDIYVADPGEHRIVRYSKTGAITAQYVSPAWSDLRAFTVDLTAQQLYVLSGTKVTRIPLIP